MKYKLISVLVFFGFLGCKTTEETGTSAVKDLADGSDWCHQRLQSTDGTKISIDFQVESLTGQKVANPLWINVERPNLGSSNSVHVVLIERLKSYGRPEHEGRVIETDLQWSSSDGRFTGKVADLLVNSTSLAIVGHEIAFRIDNDWLKDPVSGNSNFRANFYEITEKNNFICQDKAAPAAVVEVKNWRSLPSQNEIDDLMSKPLNDPAHPYTDYRPGAPGANMDLPGEAILKAMRRSRDKFNTGKGGSSHSTLNSCLFTGYAPTHWPDIAIHYYCLMNEPRSCYTYSTSGQIPRYNSFKGCIGQWNGNGAFQYQNYVAQFSWVKDDQPLEFQYVMFGQTNAFKPEQEQAIINAFWGVNNANSRDECNQKRPRRSEDPTDGTHCQVGKKMRTSLIGRGR